MKRTQEIIDTPETREKNPELFVIDTEDKGRMGTWCGCGWWKKRKYGYRLIIKEINERNRNMAAVTSTVCNFCNKLSGPSGYYFKPDPSIEERVTKFQSI